MKSGQALILLLFLFTFIFAKPLLLFLFPGLLIFYLPLFKKFSFVESLLFVIVLSLSFSICGFWFLKFIPLPVTVFLNLTFWGSLVVLLAKYKGHYSLPSFKMRDISYVLLTIVLIYLFHPLYFQQIAPSGADMARHTLVARLIQEKNRYPENYQPLLPITHFGASPFGFSLIAANISLLSKLPVYRSTLLLTMFAYPLFGLGLYIFLKNYFSSFISLLTTFLVLFSSIEVTRYLYWGGNPTIVSIAFLLFALSLAQRMSKKDFPYFPNIFLLSSIIFASFTTHNIPPTIASFSILPVGLYLILKNPSRGTFLPLIYLFLSLALLSVPFLTSTKLPTKETIDWVKDWQRNQLHSWTGNWFDSVKTIPLYIKARINSPLFDFSIAGLIVSLFVKNKYKYWFYLSLFTIFVIILNSRYWFLPLSPLLYPDRTVTVALVPISFFAAFFLSNIQALLKKFGGVAFSYLVILILFLIFPAEKRNILNQSKLNYKDTLEGSRNESSVTPDDIKAFDWISKNTNQEVLFDNNYGDAGLWIPAIAYRATKVNHVLPADFDELQKMFNHKPNYMYLGGKIVYPQMMSLPKTLGYSNLYQLVYSSGDTKVYKMKDQ